MAALLRRTRTAAKAFLQLGPARVLENSWYRLGLKLNRYRIPPPENVAGLHLHIESLPPVAVPQGTVVDSAVLTEAEEILLGKVRLYGAEPVPLVLNPGQPLRPWTDYERGSARAGSGDIKDVWEPARFGWAVSLARAYRMNGDERCARAFWQAFEVYDSANPPYLGPHWASGQEAAIRILTWAFVLRALISSPESTPGRQARLASAIYAHACRIPPTLIYARSQRNNHLISEAAGLYTAGCLLPEIPSAGGWRKQGWDLLNRAVQDQFEPDGAYIQQSINYHRLALQTALWAGALARQAGEHWPELSRARLAAATRWLLARIDPISGQAPNFGHQDGTHLFPFGAHSDFRPAAQAASLAFLGMPAFPAGEWDAFTAWFGLGLPAPERVDGCLAAESRPPASPPPYQPQPETTRDSTGILLRAGPDWAFLRAAHFHYRPGQADQLHLDVWHRGQNIALDAGTYRYNAAAPWDNALASAAVHNSVTVYGQEPMTRAGRFLWLDWDQAETVLLEPDRVTVERSGYRKIGLRHRRSIRWTAPGEWQIQDELLPIRPDRSIHTFVLHWLLPEGDWELSRGRLLVKRPEFTIRVEVACPGISPEQASIQLIRAGTLLSGQGDVPVTAGWVSPTYAHKQPALSFHLAVTGPAPLTFLTVLQALDNPSGVR